MVPMARGADFDHITSELALFRALGEGLEFLGRCNATPESGQSRTKDIGDEDQLVVLADRAVLAGGLSDFPSGPNQFRVGVADFVLSEAALLIFRDEVLTRESVIDLAAFAARGTAEGS